MSSTASRLPDSKLPANGGRATAPTSSAPPNHCRFRPQLAASFIPAFPSSPAKSCGRPLEMTPARSKTCSPAAPALFPRCPRRYRSRASRRRPARPRTQSPPSGATQRPRSFNKSLLATLYWLLSAQESGNPSNTITNPLLPLRSGLALAFGFALARAFACAA